MNTYMLHLLVPISIHVDADTEEAAIQSVLSLREYAPLDPDGNYIDLQRDDIKSVEEVTP